MPESDHNCIVKTGEIAHWLSACCSYGRPELESQCPRGSLQLSIMQVPEDPMSSSDSCGHQACMGGVQTQIQAEHSFKNVYLKF